jgi:Secretion system C-terminal sorting domain
MNVFLAMKADSTLIYHGDSSDSLYVNFFNNMSSSNMNRMDSVKTLTRLLLLDEASNINDLISDTNLVVTYFKTVNNIYLDNPARGNYLTSEDSTTLEEIAILPSSLAGKTIYDAIVLTGLEIHQQSTPSSRVQGNLPLKELNKNFLQKFSVYPNPSNNKVYFVLNSVQNETYSLKIYDIQAKTVLQQVFDGSSFEIEVTQLKPGIYRYRIINSQNLTYQGNLVIVHH